MTDQAFDISALTEEQQLTLQQYTSVTDQDIAAAIPLLQRCQWNAQIAITRFFDGDTETVDVAAEAARQAPPPAERRFENLQDSFSASSFRPSNSRFQPAPRVVATPESQQTQRLPIVISLVLAPFKLGYSLLSAVFNALGWAFPFLPRLLHRLPFLLSLQQTGAHAARSRKPLSPRDTAARFIREFEEEYSVTPGSLPFQESGYAQTYDAAKRDLKYLVVVLLSPEHDDTPTFVRDTLLSGTFKTFLEGHNSDTLLWGGSVRDAEAYQVSNALNVTKFPFVGLIVHTPSVSPTAMSLVARAAGPTPASELVQKLQAVITERDTELVGARAQRSEQQAARDIRGEQDSAYERSLALDRERARQRREAAAAQERLEREAKEVQAAKERKAQHLEEWRRWRSQTIGPEPDSGNKEAVRISIRLKTGERLVRRFDAKTDLEELYAFVECHSLLQDTGETSALNRTASKPQGYQHEYGFQLVSPMPREVYDLAKGGLIRDRIGRSGNLIVERTDLDEVDETDEELEHAP